MREIKFKYYFLLNKIVLNTKIFIMEDIEDINFNTILFLNVDCNKDNFENMELYRSEYIGLKDKNGVEIYEGDIVKRNLRKYETIEKIFTITMLDLELLLKIKNSGGYGYEVIGNIYENKELLK